MPVNIFFCYARKDKALRDELENHLEPLRRSGQIITWHDREIQPGTDWKREIEKQLDTADIILLLVSPDFMASDYCYGVELKRAMERHERGEVRVVPIILRPVLLIGTPIGKLNPLPTNGRAITVWPNPDEAFLSVAEGINKVIEAFLVQRVEEGKASRSSGTPLVTSIGSQSLFWSKIHLSRRAILIGLAGVVITSGGITWLARPRASQVPSSPLLSPTIPIHPSSSTLYAYHGHFDVVNAVAWSPDGIRIASGSNDETVKVWNVATGVTLLSYQEHSNEVVTVAWSPNSGRIASGSLDNTVQVWYADSGKRILTLPTLYNHSIQVAWSLDGSHICIDNATVQVRDAATGNSLLSYRDPTNNLLTMAWSPDNKYIASGGDPDGTVHVFNANTGSKVYTYHNSDSQSYALAIAWSPKGKHIAAAYNNNLRVFDAITGDDIITLSADENNFAVAWSPDGTRIASGGANKLVHIWDAFTGKHLFAYHGHVGYVLSIAWSPDGTRIASGGEDKIVQVWTPQ